MALDTVGLAHFMRVLAMDRAGQVEAKSLGMTKKERLALVASWREFVAAQEELPSGAPWLEGRLALAAGVVQRQRELLESVRRLLERHRDRLVEAYDEERVRDFLGKRVQPEPVLHRPTPPTRLPPVPPEWPELSEEQHAEADQYGVPVRFENDLGMRFVLIPSGKFAMGAPGEEEGRNFDETRHMVTITKPYYMQITEVTNGQFRWWKPQHCRRTSDESPHHADQEPVVHVCHETAEQFAVWLTERGTVREYVLPTEAQWERACRAGTTTRYSSGATEVDLLRVGWVKANAGIGPHAVAGKPANRYGLHDMHGNVYEWCSDWYGDYPSDSLLDPVGPSTHEAPLIDMGEHPWRPRHSRRRVLRGGSFFEGPDRARSAARSLTHARDRDFHFGFRLVSPLPARD